MNLKKAGCLKYQQKDGPARKNIKLLPNLDKNIIKKSKEREMKPLHTNFKNILKSDEFISWKSSKAKEMAWKTLDCGL